MRYQLLIYPTLAIFAAWFLVRLYDWRKQPASVQSGQDSDETSQPPARNRWAQALAVLISSFVLVTTAVYALGFTNIYQQPITRIAASRWIYQNIPGPITIPIENDGDRYNQQVPFPYNYTIRPDLPYYGAFNASRSGEISQVQLGRVIDPQNNFGQKKFSVTVSEAPAGMGMSTTASTNVDFSPNSKLSEQTYSLSLQQPLQLNPGQEYYLSLQLAPGEGPIVASGSLDLSVEGEQTTTETVVFENAPIDYTTPYYLNFIPKQSGLLTEITLKLAEPTSAPGEERITLILSAQPNGVEPLAAASASGQFASEQGAINFILDEPVSVQEDQTIYLTIEYTGESEGITLKGTALANEGHWDDGLPVRLDDYDAFGGIYETGLNFDMYEDDNPNKLARFLNILDQAEYILISSNRQWGSLPRLPKRFPMTTEYYRRLLGCPQELSIQECYNSAEPGDFQGDLGFELVQVFQSNPTLGALSVNDQFAEEAFTVYDHPKVFIFKKQDSYDPQRVRDILGAIDLTKVVHVTPKMAESLPKDMLLTTAQSAIQRANGTWSELFNSASPLNRWPYLGLVVWYLVLSAVGWLVYPLVRFALPGLSDKGFPLSRIVGLLILSYLVWLAGSFQIQFTRLTITLALGLIAGISILLAYWQKDELRQEWRDRRTYFLLIEGLFLAFFIFDLLIRLGNPDLWHPWKGGERPMDFSFFNAILKSSVFPPYDPWFAGGYINYYYYGFVLVGVLVKWLGIQPSVAYNLIIPTVFSLIAMGAFSIGWNLMNGSGLIAWGKSAWGSLRSLIRSQAFVAGSAAALGMAVFGNLGTIRMILVGYQKVAAPGGTIEGVNFITRILWTFKGAINVLTGAALPYGLPDWYWLPSRVIPAPNDVEPITEFPFFTVLYGDPHAHLFALPLTLLAISWGLSVLFSQAWLKSQGKSKIYRIIQVSAGFFLGGLAIGVLRPTNTWDFPTYLALGIVLCGYAIWKYYPVEQGSLKLFEGISPRVKKATITIAGMVVLAGLSFLLFQPYAEWYVQGYTRVDPWKGTHTPFWSYLTHWGVFLFVIISWMTWETREWMAMTPLRAVRKLEPYKVLIIATMVILVVWVFALLFMGVSIGWFVLPLAAWAAVLLLKPGLSDPRRVVLLMVGGGLLLTLVVEVIVLRGDIGRMNTVFKFYLQVWTLFAISAAAGFGWMLETLRGWDASWRTIWKFGLGLLVFSAALYPLLGGTAKIKDRMAPETPLSLDGMAYMQYASYDDLNVSMDLNQDYQAIRWLQENVQGSPVIIEGNMVEYHWGTRNTIYTGLPNVVGWNWHERQQRARGPENLITGRITEVNEFYLETDPGRVKAILEKYGIEYIIVGQLERALYPGAGLDKFEQMDGILWQEVFRVGDTVIYQVINN
jgi:YYY domain-containing protein